MAAAEEEVPLERTNEALTANPDLKRGVMAVDPATIAMAFREFSKYIGMPFDQLEPTEVGAQLFEGLDGYEDKDFDIHDVVSDAGGEDKRAAMNQLARDHGFKAPFTGEFGPNQIGILSVIDKTMTWHEGDAEKHTLRIDREGGHDRIEGVRFKLWERNDEHFAVFDVDGFSKPVVRIADDPEYGGGVQNYMWVTEISPEDSPSLTEMFTGVKNAVDLVSQRDGTVAQRGAAEVASVQIPRLKMVTYARDWEELKGTQIGGRTVAKAHQSVRVDIDEIGARATAKTDLFGMRIGKGRKDPREHIVIGNSGPMLVWFTEGDSHLPICATITTQEAWTAAGQA